MNYYDVIEALAAKPAEMSGDVPLSFEERLLLEQLARSVVKLAAKLSEAKQRSR